MIFPAYANQPKQNSENELIKAKICLRQSRVIFASIAFEEFRLVCISRRFFFGYFLLIDEKKVTLEYKYIRCSKNVNIMKPVNFPQWPPPGPLPRRGLTDCKLTHLMSKTWIRFWKPLSTSFHKFPAFAKQLKQNFENALIKAKICLRRSRVIFAPTCVRRVQAVLQQPAIFLWLLSFHRWKESNVKNEHWSMRLLTSTILYNDFMISFRVWYSTPYNPPSRGIWLSNRFLTDIGNTIKFISPLIPPSASVKGGRSLTKPIAKIESWFVFYGNVTMGVHL